MANAPGGLETPSLVLPLVDLPIDALTTADVVDTIVARLAEGRGGTVVTPNVDHLHKLRTDARLQEAYAGADLVVADGMPLVWASRLLGRPLPERVAGSHLFPVLTDAAADHGRSIFVLGGSPGSAEQAVAHAQQRRPDLVVAGIACPPLGFDADPAAVEALCHQVAGAAPDLVFTALGAPKQEWLNARLRQVHPAAWYLGVGAAVDMAAGTVTRAPVWAQRLGLEWLFRLAQEPGRMARRYLVDDLPFALRLLAASAAQGRRERRAR